MLQTFAFVDSAYANITAHKIQLDRQSWSRFSEQFFRFDKLSRAMRPESASFQLFRELDEHNSLRTGY
jgi:hypothetical protein